MQKAGGRMQEKLRGYDGVLLPILNFVSHAIVIIRLIQFFACFLPILFYSAFRSLLTAFCLLPSPILRSTRE